MLVIEMQLFAKKLKNWITFNGGPRALKSF